MGALRILRDASYACSSGWGRTQALSFIPRRPTFQGKMSTRENLRMKAAFLPDRGVVKVGGEDARNFLNGLVTTDVTLVRPGLGRFGALLTPQGKITIDFLITEAPAGHGGGFLLDVPRPLAQGLADKLKFYKLRAKVTVENLTDSIGVLAVWDGEPATKPDLAFADPRSGELGWRILIPDELKQKVPDLIG